MRKLQQYSLVCLLLASTLYGCKSVDDANAIFIDSNEVEINVSLTLADRDDSFVDVSLATRASGEMIYPITIFYAHQDETDVHLLKTDIKTSDFSIKLPNGNHEVYALCGLPAEAVPEQIDDLVNIRSLGLDKSDFALAKKLVAVENGVSSPSTLNLTASHQTALLNVTVTDETTDEYLLYPTGVLNII